MQAVKSKKQNRYGLKRQTRSSHMKKKFTIISAVAAVVLLLCVTLTACATGVPAGTTVARESRTGLDTLVSTRPSNWQRIVSNKDAFRFAALEGEPTSQFTYPAGDFGGWTVKNYDRSYGTYPAIAAPASFIPLTAEFAWQFLDAGRDVTLSLSSGYYVYGPSLQHLVPVAGELPTHAVMIDEPDQASKTIYRSRLEKPTDIVLCNGSPPESESAYAAASGTQLTVLPVCYDALVFITHKDNPVDSLTLAQARQIYSGEITNWNQIGGKNQKITAYQRESGTDVQQAMAERVMQGTKATAPPMTKTFDLPWGAGTAISKYENKPGSIGYTFKVYAEKFYNDPDIKVLKIDGIAPTDDNLRSGAYALSETCHGVIRAADADAVGGKFLGWLLSEEGQRVIRQAGYVTLQ